MRKSGILAHPTSFPSKYGIGDLGKGAYEFVDFLEKSGQKLWQILPLGQTSFGDSPYQSFSAFAGNIYIISPDIFVKKGYLSKKAFDVEFKDILLNQWGIKHLHLTDKEANSIEEMKNNRSNILLFFIVDNQDVYFLDVRKHPKGAGFITLEVLYIVYNNRWMEKIGARKVEGIIDLQPEIDSNEELYKLYKNGINYNILKFGNEVYMMGLGVSSKGHKMDYSIILCELNRKISQISCKYGDRYAGFELTLDGHFGNVILEGSGNKILI